MALRQGLVQLCRRGLAVPQVQRDAARALTTSNSMWQTTAERAGQAAGLQNEGKQSGWGQTRIHEVLEDKADSAGAWLWVSKDDFVIDAVRKMTKGKVGSLLVFDPEKISFEDQSAIKSATSDAVVGIVTERDYLTKVVVVGKSSSTLHVAEIMTPQSKLMTMSPYNSVLEAMALMMDKNIRHVPVVDRNQYLGMISIRDVVGTMVQEHREEVGRLHEYIQGSY